MVSPRALRHADRPDFTPDGSQIRSMDVPQAWGRGAAAGGFAIPASGVFVNVPPGPVPSNRDAPVRETTTDAGDALIAQPRICSQPSGIAKAAEPSCRVRSAPGEESPALLRPHADGARWNCRNPRSEHGSLRSRDPLDAASGSNLALLAMRRRRNDKGDGTVSQTFSCRPRRLSGRVRGSCLTFQPAAQLSALIRSAAAAIAAVQRATSSASCASEM